MTEFSFRFRYDDFFGVPTIRIFIDEECLYDGEVLPNCVVAKNLTDGEHNLVIEHYGKHEWQHQNETRDRHVELLSIVANGVDLDHHEHCPLTHRGHWHPNYQSDGISPCHWLGNNGNWILHFRTPVLKWIIDCANPAGVSPDETLDKSSIKSINDIKSFFNIDV